ncbi:MAG: hypothetical protein AAF465_03325 [Pseudomonadota bacterium]
MKNRQQVWLFVAMFVCAIGPIAGASEHASVGHSAQNAELETQQKSKAGLTKEQLAQIVCVKQRRAGTRIVENKCQSVAAWKRDMEQRDMRSKHLIRASGKAAAWEISPGY